MKLQVLNIAVTLGTSATITVAPFAAEDYEYYKLIIGQKIPVNEGTEPVSITDGTTTFPLTDNAGNVVVIGKIRGLRSDCCGNHPKVAKYLLQYGSNGLPTAIPHFVVKKGLCPLIYNGTAGALNDDDEE